MTAAPTHQVNASALTPLYGRLISLTGTILKARLDSFKIGELCLIKDPVSGETRRAEVIGIDGEDALLTLMGSSVGLASGSMVITTGMGPTMQIGDGYLGRVIGPFGDPLDDMPPIETGTERPLVAMPPNPMHRQPVRDAISTGVRVIDGLLTCGVGQRLGIFGSAGTGKSTLITQLMRGTSADIVVLGLVGERGREVREFCEELMADSAAERSVLVVSTSDSPPLERLRAADAATAIAEHFRDQGKNVLLIVDSVTRVARAQREVGLAAGEPPTRRGYPPSVFSHLPTLVERAGMAEHGSITAFYTVLVEGDDDSQDPVADELRGLLDGHIVLSRDIAAKGQFPAIDVGASVSRLMNAMVDDEHRSLAAQFRSQLKAIDSVDLLVKVGEYVPGQDHETDLALANKPKLEHFLYPSDQDATSFDDMLDLLRSAVAPS